MPCGSARHWPVSRVFRDREDKDTLTLRSVRSSSSASQRTRRVSWPPCLWAVVRRLEMLQMHASTFAATREISLPALTSLSMVDAVCKELLDRKWRGEKRAETLLADMYKLIPLVDTTRHIVHLNCQKHRWTLIETTTYEKLICSSLVTALSKISPPP